MIPPNLLPSEATVHIGGGAHVADGRLGAGNGTSFGPEAPHGDGACFTVGHRGVDTSARRVLAIALGKGECRVRKDHGPQNPAMLRHIALDLPRAEKIMRNGIENKRPEQGGCAPKVPVSRFEMRLPPGKTLLDLTDSCIYER